MRDAMEAGVGIYRKADTMQQACTTLAGLAERYRHGIRLDDRSRAFNTEWLTAIELGFMLDVARAMAHSALNRRESRGAHMRLDGFEARDDANFLKHTLATHADNGSPRISYMPVNITRSKPEARVYGGAGKQAVLT
jgi:fumarate reductase flavoprotein subunit